MRIERIENMTRLMEQVLSLTEARQRVLAHNLANINTPGFVRRDIPFEEALREAVANPGRSPDAFRVLEDESGTFRSDGNNIDLEREIAELTKNRVLHEIATQFLGGKVRQIRMAISGRTG
ncbi:MAG: flagellar basal body protein [Planctomycetota bacterium]